MAQRDEIIACTDELLEIGRFDDYGPNGLQVPGTERVERIVSGVSAQLELLERAAELGAELVIAHHGLFWDFHPRALSQQLARRLRVALGGGISVAAYHLPLDAHPSLGNNALLRERLGFDPDPRPFAAVRGSAIGAVGTCAGIAAEELFARVEALTGRAPLVFDAGPPQVRSIGICSGAAAGELAGAIALGLDAFLTGEPAEHVMADAREGGVHFIAAGHYATETLGIRALGELLAARFGVEHEFVDIPNPV